MRIGADYYPEHWPEERWPEDARLMAQAGFNTVRLAEFAWSRMEPEEGKFEFGWLERAVEALARKGIQTVLGTPTASMPPWAARNYPEVLATRPDGSPEIYGHRKYACLSSPAYRRLSEKITSAMAARFAANPAVIGWQTDNEFDAHPCHCQNCREAFHSWLEEKYGSLAALNAAWGTVFWSHEYSAWSEIPFPRSEKTVNPGLALDYRRFVTRLNAEFQKGQVKILRRDCPGHFITHNFQESYTELDYHTMAEDLDFAAWNSYPIWGKPGFPYSSAAMADTLRGLKGRNFWTMEQVCGNQGWSYMSRSVRDGEVKRLLFQQISRGADGFLWFRWRTCPFGWEQNAHGILSYDGIPRRRYRECAAAARDALSLAGILEGTSPRAQAAMILDYESSWAVQIQPGFIENAPGWWLAPGEKANLNDYGAQFMRYYRALLRAGVNVDVVRPDTDLGRYRLIVAPQLLIMPDARAKRLEEFVDGGGVLVTDLLTGLKDSANSCQKRLLPGILRRVLKLRIEEYESLPEDAAVRGRSGLRGAFRGHIACCWAIPEGAQVLAGYGNPHLKNYAAVTYAKGPKGAAYYVGTIAREEGFYDRLMLDALKSAGILPPTRPPAGVEAASREKNGAKLLFLINHAAQSRQVRLPDGPAPRALLGPQPARGVLKLPPGGVCVLSLNPSGP